MTPGLFGEPDREPVSADEVTAILAAAMRPPVASALPRSAEMHLASVCAEHLVQQLALAGLVVVRVP